MSHELRRNPVPYQSWLGRVVAHVRGGYFLWRFMIAEGHQRRGIGRRAMQQVLEHWRELGVTAARTSVVPSNTGATRLYESLGFRLTGEEDHGELVMSLDM